MDDDVRRKKTHACRDSGPGKTEGDGLLCHEFELDGHAYVIASFPTVTRALPDSLTDAEAQVASQLLRGSSNSEIAELRDTSERTVANQVRSVFDKLDVKSRAELLQVFLTEADDPCSAE